MDGSFHSLEALPREHLQIVFVASSSCSEDDSPHEDANTPKPQRQPSVKSSSLANGDVSLAQPNVHEVKAKTRRTLCKTKKELDKERTKKTETERKVRVEEEVLDTPADGWPLRRVISIEEDHLPHLLQGAPQPLVHLLADDDASLVNAPDVSVTSNSRLTVDTEAPAAKKSHVTRIKKNQESPRGQPVVGKETRRVNSI